MPEFIEVKLSNDKSVRVYAPPSVRLSQLLAEKYPDPSPPIRESKTVTGDIIKMTIDDDPEYLREKKRIEELRMKEIGELTILFALKEIEVPEDFSMDAIKEIVSLSDPNWKPREGKMGRKLDYIEWVLLANPGDQLKVQEALVELSGIDLDAVRATEDSFRD